MLTSIFKLLAVLHKASRGRAHSVAGQLLGCKYLAQTQLARRLRQFRVQTVLAISAVACAYVVAAFVANALVQENPKSSQDSILRNRLSSPLPAKEIIIVDIDERSLALLSPTHGRWPWSRDVFADALDRIRADGASGILFNVLMSDPDKAHPDADAAMAFAAGMATNTAFPMIRLPKENDAHSDILASAIPGARINSGQNSNGQKKVALIVPMFAEMQERLGVVNQQPDSDGIVRRYPVWWNGDGYALKSAVLQTLDAGGFNTRSYPDGISLNWRNKHGSYTRVSFADLFSKDPKTSARVAQHLRGAWVILGASAPGVGQVKATPMSPITDDNEILATAMDDMMHGTYLRIIPPWITFILTLVAIVFMTSLVFLNVKPRTINKAFIVVQVGLSGITLLSVSYSNYLVDLSEPISLLLLIFSIIKLVSVMETRNFRGIPHYFDLGRNTYRGAVHIVGFNPARLVMKDSYRLLKGLETNFGIRNVVRIDNLFNDGHLVPDLCANYHCLVIFDEADRRTALVNILDSLVPDMAGSWHIDTNRFEQETVVRSREFSDKLMLWLVSNVGSLLSRRLLEGPTEPTPGAAH
jgi:CHASE2 domain-containing sensor protein